jgi:hypothetical protein
LKAANILHTQISPNEEKNKSEQRRRLHAMTESNTKRPLLPHIVEFT